MNHDAPLGKGARSELLENRPAGGFLAPFLGMFLGEIASYGAARIVMGDPVEFGLHGGAQLAVLGQLLLALGGQSVGAVVWMLAGRPPRSLSLPIYAGLAAGVAGGMVIALWAEQQATAVLHREGFSVVNALVGTACCGAVGALSGMAVGAATGALLMSWRNR